MSKTVSITIELPETTPDLQALHVFAKAMEMLRRVDDLPARMAGLSWARSIIDEESRLVSQAALERVSGNQALAGSVGLRERIG